MDDQAMVTMELTQVYLERDHKKGLQAKAKANGTKVAEEVRRAVDAYLSGISPEDLRFSTMERGGPNEISQRWPRTWIA